MRKVYFIITMILAFGFGSYAQNLRQGGRPETVEAIKIAYFTRKLNLTPEEAQKFWPIYNQYIAEIRKTRADARANNTKDLDLDEKLLNIRKRYDGEFSKALTKEKVNTFFRAEKEFGTVLQKELLERRQNQLNRRRLKQIP